jgi:hypothetical protein
VRMPQRHRDTELTQIFKGNNTRQSGLSRQSEFPLKKEIFSYEVLPKRAMLSVFLCLCGMRTELSIHRAVKSVDLSTALQVSAMRVAA